MTAIPPCSICGQASARQFADLDDRIFGTPVRASYYRCSNASCLHLFNWPVLAAVQIPTLYSEYSTHKRGALSGYGAKARLFEAVVSAFGAVDRLSGQITRWRMMDMAGRTGAVLDVGCGSGNLMEALRGSGHEDLYGVDFDPKAIRVARGAGLDVSVGEVSDIERRDFDIVLMNHVIEHLPSPEETLNEVRARLKPGGTFIIRTPNSRSFLAKRFGSDWRGLEPPRHLNIFTTASLAQLAAKTGFKTVEIGTAKALLQGSSLECAELYAANLTGLRKYLTRAAFRLMFPLLVFLASVRRALDGTSGEEVYAVLQREG
jgi:2-polyprenyl-3-methyl-5-hydroxy-6-metoxy-1,4-benzoquinol methylase